MRFEEVLHDVFMDYDRGLIEPTRQYEFGTQPFKINIHDEKIEIAGVEVTDHLPTAVILDDKFELTKIDSWNDSGLDFPEYNQHGNRFYDALFGLRAGELWVNKDVLSVNSYVFLKNNKLYLVPIESGEPKMLESIPLDMIFSDRWVRSNVINPLLEKEV